MEKKTNKKMGSKPWKPDATSLSLTALSRILAVLFLMLLPGVAGGFLDRVLGTQYWMAIGFVVGMLFMMVGLYYVVKIGDIERRQAAAQADQAEDSEDTKPMDADEGRTVAPPAKRDRTGE